MINAKIERYSMDCINFYVSIIHTQSVVAPCESLIDFAIITTFSFELQKNRAVTSLSTCTNFKEPHDINILSLRGLKVPQ